MTSRPLFAAAVVLLTAAALCFRLPDLGNRPFHGDEAVHAVKFRELWEHGYYAYDPNEFHGPTIYYAALPIVALSGHHRFADTTESDYRLAVALIGAAMIPLLLLLRRFLGTQAVLWAGLFTAISPAMVFYSRYFIQEMALVCFTLAFLGCAWSYRKSRRIGWAAGAGIAAGLMIASKETAVISFAAAGAAWLMTARKLPATVERGVAERGNELTSLVGVAERGNELTSLVGPRPIVLPDEMPMTGGAAPRRRRWEPLFVGTGVALVVAYLFLSGFLTHPAGPLGYFHTYTPWLRRAGSTELHRFPWYHYLDLYFWHHPAGSPVWSEALILVLAVVGGVAAFLRNRTGEDDDPTFVRFLAVYTLLLTFIYSAIPYKTPWSGLSFLHGMILLAGFGATSIVRSLRPVPLKAVARLAILAASVQLAWQAYRASFVMYVDQKNPYVYAQPVPEVVEIGKMAEDLAKASPQGKKMVIKVIWNDPYYWPIPWYLRRFDNVGYWTAVPPDPAAPLVLCSPELDEPLTKKLDATHIMTGFKGLRPGVPVESFVDMKLWERYLKTRPKPPPE
jgi:uncharacterized protein (TIGR03663 family)